ncbi:hypothetical protein BO85DRAFT_203263 [Aspergillus piperis CBS 112811]|uniref:Uncharacterized protein n=1 Tax=Aspergillus piperis CBS 112811 TaxID=1448313 RepID=A0A8G1VJ40_9EURO|nr:hypothetical protein BO85DRAFT_203263 [Aspergillus piperis CBS 112811]RAH52358.1 hypothetical protein BO85DRAFT_203263 [Aspergillus piperis CBS 112811]
MEDDGIDSLTVYGPVCCACMYVCTMYVCMWALILFPSPQFYAVLSFLPVPLFFCLLRSPINFSQRSSSRRSLITHFANPSFSPSLLVAFHFSYLCLANQYYAHCSDFPLLHIRSPSPQTCLTYCTLFDFLARLADVYSSLILHDSPLLTIKQPPNKAPPFLLLANHLL